MNYPPSDSELDKMSYPPSDSKLDNSCYLIPTSGITVLIHDLIGKAEKAVYLINNVVYFGGNWQDEDRFYLATLDQLT